MENWICLLVLTLYTVSAMSVTEDKPRERCMEKTKYYGCMYFKSFNKCFCTTRRACKDPFKFKNEHQCLKHVSKQQGACKRFPCENQAKCIAIKSNTKYVCDCTGTGFYGKRCHKACPKASDLSMEWLQQFLSHKTWKNTPIACITTSAV